MGSPPVSFTSLATRASRGAEAHAAVADEPHTEEHARFRAALGHVRQGRRLAALMPERPSTAWQQPLKASTVCSAGQTEQAGIIHSICRYVCMYACTDLSTYLTIDTQINI